MTPTERAAVAAAIAALDWAKDFVDSHTRESDNYQATTWLTKDGMRRYLTIGDIRRANAALASLRAVAPAPAESVGEDKTANKIQSPVELACMSLQDHLFGRSYDLGNLAMGKDCIHVYARHRKSAYRDRPSEWAGFPIIWHFDTGPAVAFAGTTVAPAPADQSDAGRDGVTGDTEAEDLLRWAAQLLSDAMEADWSSIGWCIDAHIVDEKITAFLGRVLASAPSETVGRGEDNG